MPLLFSPALALRTAPARTARLSLPHTSENHPPYKDYLPSSLPAAPSRTQVPRSYFPWTDVLKRPCRNDRAAPPRAAARKARWTGVPFLREYAVLTDTDSFRPAAYVHRDSPREEVHPAPLTSPQCGRHKFPDPL